MSTPDARELANRLLGYLDASPSPYHACDEAAQRLEQVGYVHLEESEPWPEAAGGRYVLRGGSLVAWRVPAGWSPERGFRIVGAHTDSPNLRIKPQPDVRRAGWKQLGVEVYGGVLLNSWLDRDLGLSGRVFVRGPAGEPQARLLLLDRPVLRVPQLAIHLNRTVNEDGLKLNAQAHMAPVWGVGAEDERGFRDLVAGELGVAPADVLSWEVMCHPVQPSALIGFDEDLISAPRLDNLCSSYLGLAALLEAGDAEAATVLTLFDHEEVGSTSRAGAGGSILGDLLERIVISHGGAREDWLRALSASVCVSADMAHATHPNYVEKHEPEHHLRLNGGPVIKLNANQRYASEGETEALFQLACERAGVPFQKWVNRTDLGCGSTIGPMTAARVGIRTVDVGIAQLAMHSSRELCGAEDPALMARALVEFFRS